MNPQKEVQKQQKKVKSASSYRYRLNDTRYDPCMICLVKIVIFNLAVIEQEKFPS